MNPVRRTYARAWENACEKVRQRIRSPLSGEHTEPSTDLVRLPNARRVAISPQDAAEFGTSWLSFDKTTGRFEVVKYFARGPSYAAELPAELTEPLREALELAIDAMVPLLEEDVET